MKTTINPPNPPKLELFWIIIGYSIQKYRYEK